jgi:hypothetical protein
LVDADWGQALGSAWGADASKVRCVRDVPGTNSGADADAKLPSGGRRRE